MLRENLAERLFCDLKNAEIKIEKPNYVIDGAKIGDYPNMEQVVLSCLRNKYNFNKGPACDCGDKTFTQAYTELSDYIKEMKAVRFHSLVLPKRGVIAVDLIEYESVTSRYIKDYLPNSDDVLERWDLMVQRL